MRARHSDHHAGLVLLVYPDAHGRIALCSLNSGQVVRTVDDGSPVWYSTDIPTLALTPRGDMVITLDQSGRLRRWNLDGRLVDTAAASGWTNKRTRDGVEYQTDQVLQMEVLPDGERVLFASVHRRPRIIDLVSGQEICAYAGHEGPVDSVALAFEGNCAVSASRPARRRLPRWRAVA